MPHPRPASTFGGLGKGEVGCFVSIRFAVLYGCAGASSGGDAGAVLICTTATSSE